MKKAKFIVMISILSASVNTISAQGKALKYMSDTAKLQGYFVPAAVKAGEKKVPGIVIIHAWMGITDHEKNSADKLGKLGYNVLAADIYGENVHVSNPKDAGAQAGYYKKNYQVYQQRIKSAIEALVKQGTDPDNIVVMGYCFGGTGALEAARAGFPVKGVVSFHGGLGKDTTRTNTPISTRVLALHGADDPYVPETDVKQFRKEMKDSKADWQMVYYANAVHAFTDPAAGNDNSKGAAYNEIADKRSWKAMLNFLDEVISK